MCVCVCVPSACVTIHISLCHIVCFDVTFAGEREYLDRDRMQSFVGTTHPLPLSSLIVSASLTSSSQLALWRMVMIWTKWTTSPSRRGRPLRYSMRMRKKEKGREREREKDLVPRNDGSIENDVRRCDATFVGCGVPSSRKGLRDLGRESRSADFIS
jgi:hypothetical protein